VPPSPIRKALEWLLIATFLIAISLPLVGKLLPSTGAFALTENRLPAPMPSIRLGEPGWGWSIASFPRRFERYWNDSFAFRWYLIRAHSLAKLALGASPSQKVILGESGYLYYSGQRSLDYFRGTHPFTRPELERSIQELERRQRLLAAKGIRYLIVVAPNKETIYPEFMPDRLRPVSAVSRLDQLIEGLKAHSDIPLLDLRPALRTAKQRGRVYHTTDTHWNDLGSMAASVAVLDRLSAWYPEIDRAPVEGEFVTRRGSGGDLARMLALEDRFPEDYVEWKPARPPRSAVVSQPAPGSVDPTIHACPGCRGPVVAMVEDSFNENLAPLLAEHVPLLVRVDGFRLVEPLLDRYKPDVVIEQFVERKLICWQADC
jgi:hypothetical protein